MVCWQNYNCITHKLSTTTRVARIYWFGWRNEKNPWQKQCPLVLTSTSSSRAIIFRATSCSCYRQFYYFMPVLNLPIQRSLWLFLNQFLSSKHKQQTGNGKHGISLYDCQEHIQKQSTHEIVRIERGVLTALGLVVHFIEIVIHNEAAQMVKNTWK